MGIHPVMVEADRLLSSQFSKKMAEMGTVLHACEGEMVCSSTNASKVHISSWLPSVLHQKDPSDIERIPPIVSRNSFVFTGPLLQCAHVLAKQEQHRQS